MASVDLDLRANQEVVSVVLDLRVLPELDSAAPTLKVPLALAPSVPARAPFLPPSLLESVPRPLPVPVP